MFTREELLKSREYWLENIQNRLFEKVEDYIRDKKINRTKLAEELGVSKGYISQILSGSFDHRISKLVDILIAINIAPEIPMERTLDDYIRDDSYGVNLLNSEVRGIVKCKIPYKFKISDDESIDNSIDYQSVPNIDLNNIDLTIEEVSHYVY